ncbi:MAG: hypothetical protein LBG70_00200, partial [Bifidobacteriaceae bacterium]|nr:hypothetical protein [Bifidobacteriaceae bacterium]
MIKSTPPASGFSNRWPKLCRVGLAVCLFGSLAAPLPAVAAEPTDDVIVLTVARGSLSQTAFADLLADQDIIGTADAAVQLLGDSATAAQLSQAGAQVVGSQTYGQSIAGSSRVALTRTRALVNYPLPSRLAGNEYPTFYGGYRTVAAYEAFLADVAQAYPELVELVNYGPSYRKSRDASQGHDLLALRITAGANTDGLWRDHHNGKPRFFALGQAHAREIITSELLWRFIVQLVNGYGSDPEITDLLERTEVWVAPQNNPDGIELVQEGLSDPNLRYTAAGDANPVNTSKAWQRKNLNDSLFNPSSSNWNSQQPGIDLNRNFATAWGGASTSANPTSTTYKGEAPFSEPEARFEADLLTQLFGRFKTGTTTPAPADRSGVYVNLHSAAGLVIYPYAYNATANVPNEPALKDLAFRQSYFNRHDTGKAGEILYDNAGNDIDWIYDELGIPAYTWEIGSSATGSFFPYYGRVEQFAAENVPALVYTARVADSPYTTPAGPSVVTWRASHNGDGTVKISGSASDEVLGHDSGNRRPATQAIIKAEAIIGPVNQPLAGPIELEVANSSVTASFHGSVPISPDLAATDQVVRVHAQDASGAWGPWAVADLPRRPDRPGSDFENIVLDVNPGV